MQNRSFRALQAVLILLVALSVAAYPFAQAEAAIAFDAVSSGTANATSLTFSHTNGGNFLVVSAATDSGTANCEVTGITYAGVAMTVFTGSRRCGQLSPGGTVSYWLANPASGANNVVISTSATRNIVGGAVSFSGADTAGPGASSGGNCSASTVTVNVTTTRDNSFLIGHASDNSQASNDFTPGGGQTERWDLSINSHTGEVSTKQVVTAGSADMVVSIAAGSCTYGVLEVKESLPSARVIQTMMLSYYLKAEDAPQLV